MNDNIRKLAYFLIAIFAVLVVYLGYLNVVVGPKLSTDPHNRRLAAAEKGMTRGTIYDRQDVVLAEDRVVKGVKKRVYPFGPDTAHLLGFVSQRYGRTGVESTFDSYLLALDDAGKIQALVDRVLGRPRYGYDITLSVDSRLQKKAASLLAGRSGAVVALDPRTGAVLAVSSAPSFDPETVEDVVRTEKVNKNGKLAEVNITGYDVLKGQTDSAPLLNRASRGIYPPGSTFKVITGAALLESKPELLNSKKVCQGSITVDGFVLKDTGVHGNVDFNSAMAVSCNTYFAGQALDLGEENLKKAARSFGFSPIGYDAGGRIRGDYPVQGGEIPFNPGTMPSGGIGGAELASTAIGQGRTLVSPFQMALVAAGVANGGAIMRPYTLERVTGRNGRAIYKKPGPEVYANAVSAQTARLLADAMEQCVKRGTGAQASVPGVRVAGKTGSAQNPHGQTHAWFIGFAPAENPAIAVAVVVENAGGGGNVAAPVARELMRLYLKK
ncbi:MAG: penicillin-binding transpeptidase domain-containing protein [Actinobacteria bacterium]|nr:penicillin-binding transpeptidase domain-containing protein [Actinomycetota bacterium]